MCIVLPIIVNRLHLFTLAFGGTEQEEVVYKLDGCQDTGSKPQSHRTSKVTCKKQPGRQAF